MPVHDAVSMRWEVQAHGMNAITFTGKNRGEELHKLSAHREELSHVMLSHAAHPWKHAMSIPIVLGQ